MTFQTLQHIHSLLLADSAEKRVILRSEEEKFTKWCETDDHRWQDGEREYDGYSALQKARLDDQRSRAALQEFNEKEWN